MMYVWQSNRLEQLADRLAELLGSPVATPLEPEVVVVHNSATARWVSLHLAGRFGVCANVRYPLPAAFIWEVFRSVLPTLPETSAFTPTVMTWRIMGLLEKVAGDGRFAALDAYLDGGDDLKHFELARRLAETFDQYLVYRPDWIQAWESGQRLAGPAAWQADLWRELVGSGADVHWVHVQQAFFEELDGGAAAQGLPGRVALFAISALSPGYLAVLEGLAPHIDVHCYVLNPCREYWGDIVPAREQARRAGDGRGQYLESGNELLASMGRQGRDFIDQMQESAADAHEHFALPQEDSLLHSIQADILELRNRSAQEGAGSPLGECDHSLQVHVCHGPMREVEVLYDQLLALFEADEGLRPSDVVVMSPDIETYAPYVEAVFGVPGEGRLPFTIADCGAAESEVINAVFSLLDLPEGRFDANRVLALLEHAAVRRRFGLEQDDVAAIHGWVRETRIRWGIDAQDRARLGLPATSENTWRAGLDRLTLGYALPGEALFQGVLPWDGIEGGNAASLGRLQTFTDNVFELRERLAGKKRITVWHTLLAEMLDRFLEPHDEEGDEVQVVRAALAELTETALQGGMTRALTLDVVKAELHHQLTRHAAPGRFFSGGVTFCAMHQMRGLPFAVVFLIGMNDDSFPRSHRPPGFDLMAADFRRGDRSRRDEDRYLFLEALMSARRCLYISYTGASVRDNSPLPPAVLVNELFDYIRQGFTVPGEADDPLRRLVTRHPLQGFSRRYFTPRSGLFSYSQAYCEASRAAAGLTEPVPFIEAALPEPADEWRSVSLGALVRFLVNPTRYLLQLRLGLYLEEGEGLLETREPFVLDYPERRSMRETLLSRRLNGEPADRILPMLRAAGNLPHGQIGSALFGREVEAIEDFAASLLPLLPARTLEPVEIDLHLDGMRLTGVLEGAGSEGLFEYGAGGLRPELLLRLWVRHLVLNSLSLPDVEPCSRWQGMEEGVVLQPVSGAASRLGALLDLYWRGLRRPLHFFPRSAYAFVTARSSPDRSARNAWEGSEFSRGERENPYYRLAFGVTDPLDDAFRALAGDVFAPLLEHSGRRA
jgi:exodeoxyribonuclease V gamma subunit